MAAGAACYFRDSDRCRGQRRSHYGKRATWRVLGPQEGRRLLPSVFRLANLRAFHGPVGFASLADYSGRTIARERCLMRPLGSWQRFLPVALLLAACAVLLQARSDQESVPPHKDLASFPRVV